MLAGDASPPIRVARPAGGRSMALSSWGLGNAHESGFFKERSVCTCERCCFRLALHVPADMVLEKRFTAESDRTLLSLTFLDVCSFLGLFSLVLPSPHGRTWLGRYSLAPFFTSISMIALALGVPSCSFLRPYDSPCLYALSLVVPSSLKCNTRPTHNARRSARCGQSSGGDSRD